MDKESHTTLPLWAHVESLLLYFGADVEISRLASACNVSREEIEGALLELAGKLSGHGLSLVRTPDTAGLGTHPDAAELIADLRQKRSSEMLGRAALETLATILYQGPIARSEIDYIRGVNSSSTLRQLGMRGLIEKVEEKGKTCYRATADTFRFLGISSHEELPGREQFEKALGDVECA